jgi:PAS domain S-box-containing protein
VNNSYNIRKQSTSVIAQLTFNRQKYLPSRPEFMDAVVVESGKLDEALVKAAGQADIGIVIYQDTPDREAAIVFANDAYCRMVGYPLEELLMMSAWDLTLARDLELIQDRYRRRQRGEYVSNVYEKTLLRKDGTLLPVENSMSTMILLGKVATVAYSRDITEHKQAQEELNQHRHQLEELVAKRTAELTAINERLHQEIMERKWITEALGASEVKLRHMFDSVSDGIIVTDMEGKIVLGKPL